MAFSYTEASDVSDVDTSYILAYSQGDFATVKAAVEALTDTQLEALNGANKAEAITKGADKSKIAFQATTTELDGTAFSAGTEYTVVAISKDVKGNVTVTDLGTVTTVKTDLATKGAVTDGTNEDKVSVAAVDEDTDATKFILYASTTEITDISVLTDSDKVKEFTADGDGRITAQTDVVTGLAADDYYFKLVGVDADGKVVTVSNTSTALTIVAP